MLFSFFGCVLSVWTQAILSNGYFKQASMHHSYDHIRNQFFFLCKSGAQTKEGIRQDYLKSPKGLGFDHF